MARSSRRPPSRRSTAAARPNRWRPLFYTSLTAVGLSVAVLFIAIAASCGSNNSAKTSGKIPYITPTDTRLPATATPTSTDTASPTAAPQPSPTPRTGGSGGSGSGGGSDQTPVDNTPLVTCGDILAPVDKDHRLAADCVPPDLVELPADISAEGAQYMRAAAASALEQMFAAAAQAGYHLVANSTYRSYQTQAETFNYWVSVDGLAYAERTSARPGHSEHQLGTAADVGTASGLYLEAFTGTPEAAWLDANCWKYGFIVSYPAGKESITGYAFEPWHVRYVGVSVAAQVHASGKTLHEFLLGQ